MRLVFRAILRFFQEADVLLLLLCIVSSVFGMFLISSATSGMEGNFIYVQLGAALLGIVLFVLFSYIDIDIIADKSAMLLVMSMVLIATLFLWGEGDELGTRVAWLRFWGIGIQPAEVVKVPFTIIIASMLANYIERKTINTFVSLFKVVFAASLVLGLIIASSADFGSMLMYVFILLTMLFIGGIRFRWFLFGGAIIAAVFPLVWNNILEEKHRERIMAPFVDYQTIDPTRQGVLWQPDMSVRAIAAGGIYGQGIGNGRITQSGNLPGQHTDFIFSVAGEELGFAGCLVIMLLLAAIIIRCVYVGIKSNNSLGMLVCIGFAGMFIAQTLLNIGMSLGILPVIGITLPFFSYGGSSIVTFFAAAGIVSGIKMRPKTTRFRAM